MTENKKIRYDSFRIAMCAVAACALLVIAFHLYCGKLPELVQKLTDKGEYTNIIWIIEHLAAFLPVPLVAAIIALFYCNREKCVLVHSRKERVLIACVVAIFTYTVMLGYVLSQKGDVSGEEVEEIKTLWDVGAEWFFAQIIPFAVLIGYHAVRIESEEKELLENGDEKKRAEG